MLIDITRKYNDKEWKNREKRFSLFFAAETKNRDLSQLWDRSNTPDCDDLPYTYNGTEFDTEYSKLWDTYWEAIKLDESNEEAEEFVKYYQEIISNFSSLAKDKKQNVYTIDRYTTASCYMWLSKRTNVDMILSPFLGQTHLFCNEYDYTCWRILGQRASHFMAKSPFVKAVDEWNWCKIDACELSNYRNIKEKKLPSREEANMNYVLGRKINEYIRRYCTGSWFTYDRILSGDLQTPKSWVFEKKTDAMLLKLRW